MDKKKKPNWFKITLIVLFVAYVSLYFLTVTGYYDGNIRRKVEFTESQIEAFEKDIAAGEKVDIKDYLESQNKDYTNNVSTFGYKVSTNIDKLFSEGIEKILDILSKLLS